MTTDRPAKNQAGDANLKRGGAGRGGGFVQRSRLHRQAQYEKNTVAAFSLHSISSSEC